MIRDLFAGCRNDLIMAVSYDAKRLEVHLSQYAGGEAELDRLPGELEVNNDWHDRFIELSKTVEGVKFFMLKEKE